MTRTASRDHHLGLENPYSLFSALEENIKVLSLEKERMDSRYDELVANNQRQQREHEQLLDVWETSKIQYLSVPYINNLMLYTK